jgi:hypothetical protein
VDGGRVSDSWRLGLFAAITVLIVGTLNCIWGIAAIDGADFFVANGRHMREDLNTMGWVVLVHRDPPV